MKVIRPGAELSCSWEPSGCQGAAEGLSCVTGTLGLQGSWSPGRLGRKPELGTGDPRIPGMYPSLFWAPGLSSVCLTKRGQVRDGKHRLPLLPSPLMGRRPASASLTQLLQLQ